MKRIVSVLIMYILIIYYSECCAVEKLQVQEVYNQVEALGKWCTVLTDAYGQKINIDADIIMPNIELMPIISASVYENIGCEELIIEKNGKIEETTDKFGVRDFLFEFTDEHQISVSGAVAERIFRIAYGDEPGILSLKSNVLSGAEKKEYLTPVQLDLDAGYIQGNTLTLQRVLEIAESAARLYFSPNICFSLYDVIVYDHPRTLQSINDTTLGEEVSTFPSGYYICSIRQNIQGIPILLGANEPYHYLDLKASKKPTRPRPWSLSSKSPINTIRIISDRGYRLLFVPIKEERIIETDVPLCPVDNVIDSVSNLVCEGYIRDVYALRLGYACFYSIDETATNEFCLYPVWEVDCEYTIDPSEELTIHQSHREWYESPISEGKNYRRLIVNAQTGSLENPKDINSNSYDCPSMILW